MAVEELVSVGDILEPSAGTLLRRRVFRHTTFVLGASIFGFVLAVALLAPWLAPHDPYVQDLSKRLIPPLWDGNGSWLHPLGTDQLGRDYLSRLIYGARISLLIGASAMLISGVIGTTLGTAAGYFSGRIDLAVGLLITTRLAMPVILVALATAALAGSSLRNVILVLGLLLWDRFAVVTRSVTQRIRSLEYVAAARAVGCSTLRVVASEVLPNMLDAVIVVGTLEMAQAIILEAALSFLGVGVPAPLPSWGLMIAEGKEYMFFSPWVIVIPGFALFALVFAINLLGDGMRDLTAPENRG
jgi:peptide/nickel transport system permease protein